MARRDNLPTETVSGLLKAAVENLPAAPAAIDYVCGLRKVGPSRYSLVVGRIVDGVCDVKVDPISQSLDLAAEELREQFRKLMQGIP